jgi:hypothetical protein
MSTYHKKSIVISEKWRRELLREFESRKLLGLEENLGLERV